LQKQLYCTCFVCRSLINTLVITYPQNTKQHTTFTHPFSFSVVSGTTISVLHCTKRLAPISLLHFTETSFQWKGQQERKKKEMEVVFSVLNHDPFNPPKLKAEGASIFRNSREVNTHRQVGNNFQAILSKPTNQPPSPQLSTASYCRRDQASLHCVYALPQCYHLLGPVVYSLSAFSAALLLLFNHLHLKNHVIPFCFKSLFCSTDSHKFQNLIS